MWGKMYRMNIGETLTNSDGRYEEKLIRVSSGWVYVCSSFMGGAAITSVFIPNDNDGVFID